VIERNMNFKGHWDYCNPLIQEVIIRYFDQATYIAAMEAGEGDIVVGVTGFNDIMEFLALVEDGVMWSNQYDRPGFGYLGFQVDFSPTRFLAVRQAIAWTLDREEFNRIFLGGLAAIVNSEYATAQYIFVENREWIEDNLTNWTYNPAIANRLLDEDGWVFNADGSDFRVGVDPLRHKLIVEEDGTETLEPLIIEWLGTTPNPFTDTLYDVWVPSAAAIGMQVNQTLVEFAQLNMHWGRGSGFTEDMKQFSAYNLAINYTSVIVAFWNSFSIHDEFMGRGWNNHFLVDQELYDQAMVMYNATSKEEYDAAWLQVLLKLNQLVPKIPIYANIWFDFIRNDANLVYYFGDSYWSFGHAIQRAWIEE
jgi:peptide/nickel transport system substrate-binding protein